MATLLSEFNVNEIFDNETNQRLDEYVNTLNDQDFLQCWRNIGGASQGKEHLLVNAIRFHKRHSPRLIRIMQNLNHESTNTQPSPAT